ADFGAAVFPVPPGRLPGGLGRVRPVRPVCRSPPAAAPIPLLHARDPPLPLQLRYPPQPEPFVQTPGAAVVPPRVAVVPPHAAVVPPRAAVLPRGAADLPQAAVDFPLQLARVRHDRLRLWLRLRDRQRPCALSPGVPHPA